MDNLLMQKNSQRILIFLLLILHGQLCVGNYIIFSPHDVSMELGHGGYFTVNTSEVPSESELLTVKLVVDHEDVITLSNYSIVLDDSMWQYNITVSSINAGKVVVTANYTSNLNNYSTDDAFVRINVKVHQYLDVLSDVFGWMYFVCWTSTMYPQMYLNYKRKSAAGLSMDYIVLHMLGTGSYSIYNFGMYFGDRIQDEYFDEHPYGIMSIKPQDVAFSIVSFAWAGVCGLQGIYYNRKTIRISYICLGFLSAGLLFLLISAILGATGVITWLTCMYYVSYVKLGVTLIKYIPQVYSIYRNKGTTGWSVGYPILDFSGGSLSIIQMFLMAFNYNDWSSIFGNPTKLLLGLISMFFDTIFLTQHYIIYRKPNKSLKTSDSLADLQLEDPI